MKRIYHTWDKWECYPAGFYDKQPPERGMSDEECFSEYADFLRHLPTFEAALKSVLEEWPNSCEHYLSNERMNRIAWLGQASACLWLGLPSRFRGGYNRLSEDEKLAADEMALKYLNIWLSGRGESELDLESAGSKTQMDLY